MFLAHLYPNLIKHLPLTKLPLRPSYLLFSFLLRTTHLLNRNDWRHAPYIIVDLLMDFNP